MSVWCSLLGHQFGDSVVEHGKERRRDEVVFTVLEYEECARCGARTVISENTRSARLDPGEEGERPIDPSTDQQAAEEPAEPVEADEPADAGVADSAGDGPGATDRPDTAEGATPDGDGAEILGGTAPRAGPEAPAKTDPSDEAIDERPSDDDRSTADPDTTADEGPGSDGADEPITDDGEILGDDEGDTWPEHPHDDREGDDEEPTPWPTVEDDAVVVGDDAAEGLESGITAADSVPQEMSSRRSDADAILYCPRCSFRETATDSTLRVGDICPECREGYIASKQ